MSKAITKIVRLDLEYISSNECDRTEFDKIVHELQSQIRDAKNTISSILYFDLLTDYKIKPGDKRDGNQKSKRAACSDICRSKIPYLHSGDAGMVSDLVYKSFYNGNAGLSEVEKGQKAAPSYKANQPIEVRNQAIKLFNSDGTRTIVCSLLSQEGKLHYKLSDGRFCFKVVNAKSYQTTIFDRCVSGEYKVAGSKLMYNQKKNQWFINLGFTFTPNTATMNPNICVGVDLGIANVFYAAVNIGADAIYAPGSEIVKFRNCVEKRRDDLKRSRKFASPGNCGHGRKKRMEAVDKLGEKISNFRNTKNFTYAKQIVEYAVKNGAGCIQMEDLTAIKDKKNAKFLKNWTYYDLQTKIINKAAEFGIKVVKVSPQYTSQRCSCCGHISSKNRKGQADFCCVKCGNKMNADKNAAINISTIGIEKMIEHQCREQKIPYKSKDKKKSKANAA